MKDEVDVLGSPVHTSPYGLCGRKATLNLNQKANFLAAELINLYRIVLYYYYFYDYQKGADICRFWLDTTYEPGGRKATVNDQSEPRSRLNRGVEMA